MLIIVFLTSTKVIIFFGYSNILCTFAETIIRIKRMALSLINIYTL